MLEKIKNRIKRINWKKAFQTIRNIAVIMGLTAVFAPILVYFSTFRIQKQKVYSKVEDVPAKKVAIVFGAGLWADDKPSPILRDRVLAAAKLYEEGKVQKIIMSGDNRFVNYDEPSAMIELAIENGVKKKDLQPDYAGRRTYDTCYRAKHIFELDEAILVTQSFHIIRALHICNALGIDSIGFSSDLSDYPNEKYYEFRDIYALALSMIDINVRKPEVIGGERIEL